MSEPKLVSPDDPVFPKEVHNLLVAANATNITLSGMADTKASILMGASFVVFSMSIGDIARGQGEPAAAGADPVLVRRDGVRRAHRPAQPAAGRQGSIPRKRSTSCSSAATPTPAREDYIDEVIKVLSSEEETYRRLTADLYDHGKVLRDDKFRWLYWSFTLFLVGMLVTAFAVVLDLTGVLKL